MHPADLEVHAPMKNIESIDSAESQKAYKDLRGLQVPVPILLANRGAWRLWACRSGTIWNKGVQGI